MTTQLKTEAKALYARERCKPSTPADFCAEKQYTKKDNPQIIATLFERPGYSCLLEMLIVSNVSSAVVVS